LSQLEIARLIGYRDAGLCGDVKVVWVFWDQRFGTRKKQVETFAQAFLIFRGLRDFDCRQKKRYMARKFPGAWPEINKLAESLRHRRL